MYLTFDQIIGGSLPPFILILFVACQILESAFPLAVLAPSCVSLSRRPGRRVGNVFGVWLV